MARQIAPGGIPMTPLNCQDMEFCQNRGVLFFQPDMKHKKVKLHNLL